MPPPLRWGSMPRCRLGMQVASANCRGMRFQSTACRGVQLRKTAPRQPASRLCVAGPSGRRPCTPLAVPVGADRHSPNCRALSSSSTSFSVKNDTRFNPGPGERQYLQNIPREDTNGRWYFQLRERIGKCIIFGLSEAQLARAVDLVAAMSAEWEKLVLHMDEYPTDHDGLRNFTVPWGDMDSFVRETHIHLSSWLLNTWSPQVGGFHWLTSGEVNPDAGSRQQRSLLSLCGNVPGQLGHGLCAQGSFEC